LATQPSLTLLEPEAGWSAVVRLPAIEDEDAIVLRALREGRVLVHPGYFFDFNAGHYIVLSLLPASAQFEQGVTRLVGVLVEVCRE
jgi:alanine-synthesizing transaminase